ncbi:MAG: ABC transporter ATP-binding protein [Litorimonas sp.]
MGLHYADIHHSYGPVPALKGVSLEARSGEILCLLGRSGCGKSTLLNLTAGLLPVQSGTIALDGAMLASPDRNPPPEARGVGLVFQEGALFPHLTVAQNIGFGVADTSRRAGLVADLLDQIGLGGMGERYPHTLSGGQQQRVAVARALAPGPGVLLMDEPFASIDISLRRHLREETRRLVKQGGAVTLLVTHDPEEALEVADRIAVMEAGRITQIGTARELHDRPASLFVGLMAGSGAVIEARIADGHAHSAFGRFPLDRLSLDPGGTGYFAASSTVDLLLYPHRARLVEDADGLRVTDVRQTGRSQIVTVQAVDGASLLLETDPEPGCTVGQQVRIESAGRPWPAFSRRA